jgi:AraC family transcriptional regulator, regulatory protein of adaptative response / methylated-DNA-[protein]-cysteine methyltransferase
VTSAMLDAGYGSSGRFYERAAPRLGMNPQTYQRGGVGMDIRYAIVESPLGRLLVAATSRGICAVAMGDSDRKLTDELRHEYPAARMEEDRRGLSRWTKAVLARLKGKQPRMDLPVDVRATAFQWQVWNALAAIPYGSTCSYSDVAATIGRPRAARAVARACATNPVAIVIPCHRVVPGAGGTGGYRWGADRKKTLLRSERTT